MALAIVPRAAARNNFTNLDFESGTNVLYPDLPAYPGAIQFGPAFPGWSGYLGTNATDWALYNSAFLDSAGIGLETWVGYYYIEGKYSALLQSGLSLDLYLTPLSASLSQVGFIPETARSIQFKAQYWGPYCRVSLNGQVLQPVPLQTTTQFTLYSADVAKFSGTTAELTFTVLPEIPHRDDKFLVLDSILFSSQLIPTISIQGLGDRVLLGFYTVSNQNYLVEQSAHPGATSWTVYTNVIGTGKTAQIIIPATNAYSFFRFQAQ